MQFSRLYNEKSFDSRHDMATSLTFSVFNPVSACSGGISVAFYEDALSSPYGGGLEGSLGYAPYTSLSASSFTSLTANYEGLKGGHFGVGLDISGEFSKKGNGRIDGDYKNNPNTIAIRGSENSGYSLLTYTQNLSTFSNIILGQNSTSENSAIDTTLRFVLTEHGRLLKVEQMISPDNFKLLTQAYVDFKKQTAYRIACNIVCPEDNTVFKIKEFNCYGFEKNADSALDSTFGSCTQFITQNSVGQFKKVLLGSNNIFSENSPNKSFNNFLLTTSNTSPYDFRQTITYPLCANHKFLDNDSNILIARNESDYSVDVYRNLGRNVVYEYTINTNGVSAFANHGSLDNNYLFLTTLSSIEIYKRTDFNWNYFSSLNDLSGIPTNLKFRNNQGVVSFQDGSVQIFESTGAGDYTNTFVLTGISNSSEGFGQSVAIGEYFAAIGAPYKSCTYTSDGAVFVLSKDTLTNIWSQIETLSTGGNPSANFGSDVAISGDILVATRPGNTVSLNANAGLVDVYEYQPNSSYINLKNTYPPITPSLNLRLGSDIDVSGKILACRTTKGISVYNLNCQPAYVPTPIIPTCTIPLINPASIGYVQKIDLSGYVLTIQCPKPPIVPLSAYCALVSVLDAGIPLYSINGFDPLSPIYCVLTGAP